MKEQTAEERKQNYKYSHGLEIFIFYCRVFMKVGDSGIICIGESDEETQRGQKGCQ